MKTWILFAVLLVSPMLFATVAPELNKPAPDFTLKGSDGKGYTLSALTKEKKIVVLEWFNKDCPYVRKFYDAKVMQKLQEENTGKGVVWLTVASSAPGKEGFFTAAEAQKYRSEKGMKSTALLLDSEGKMGSAYQAKTTPHMFIIDRKGNLAYQGAIDDKPSANPKSLDGAQNYVSAALASVLKDEKVAVDSTTAYGCSVKYK